jgi:hypothetical protein
MALESAHRQSSHELAVPRAYGSAPQLESERQHSYQRTSGADCRYISVLINHK